MRGSGGGGGGGCGVVPVAVGLSTVWPHCRKKPHEKS